MSRVREFHKAFDQPAPSAPTVPGVELAALRMRLIDEEFKEVRIESAKLIARLRAGDGANNDRIVEIMQALVKELCDLRYVVEGALVTCGVEPDAYDEVHRSNMSKQGRRADGKVLKGPNYSPPDPELMFPSIIEAGCEEVE